MKILMVYLNNALVGRLAERNDGECTFVYDQSWLETKDAIPLSKSLPLRIELFKKSKTRPFFAGILPEEGPRKRIAGILGINEINDFAMLERIGGECAGAVSLLPKNTTPTLRSQAEYRELAEAELRQIVSELPQRPLMAGVDGVRLSLAGAQDKLPVIIHDDAIRLPLNNTPSTHILKPEPDHFHGLALNEWFCMTLGKNCGLDVADVEYRVIGDRPCILIKRYDRRVDGGETRRIHQEDFCQALGLPPERKYQAEGGPSVADCIALLREWSSLPVLDISAFVNRLIFNILIGNADAHGKNYSLLYSNNERRLAPAYDLVSTIAWPQLSKQPAMKIGACDAINALSAGDWKSMARSTNLGWPMIRERIQNSCTTLLGKLETTRRSASTYSQTVPDQLFGLIRERSERMLESIKEIK
jgi:serine/threonine-protein kinase HipA